ncbi:4'-phosphopantetheinyl transferase superfamily protein [Lachnospiraceae bacterium 54-53]
MKGKTVLSVHTENDLLHLSGIRLREDEVHLWLVKWEEVAHFIKTGISFLPDGEKAGIRRLKFYEDRMRSGAGKLMSRILASHYLGLGPEEIVIRRDQYGKPMIKNQAEKMLQHNLSHSGAYVALAFTYRGAVGVDIESAGYFPEYKDIACFFQEEERKAIQESEGIGSFYKFWTAKEAYAKALGKGLLLNFREFEVNKNEIYENGIKNESWEVIPYDEIPGYPSAVVVSTD